MKHSSVRVVSGLVAAAILSCAASTAQANEEPAGRGSFSSCVVNAKPEIVYNSIIKLREDSADTVKTLSHEGNECLIEETFDSLPIIGEAKCVYKEVYTPHKKIEYYMIRSAKFKAFEGKWMLHPTDDGEGTKLSLSSFVDVDLPVPFAKQLTSMTTMKGVKRRLKEVKANSEKLALSSKPHTETH